MQNYSLFWDSPNILGFLANARAIPGKYCFWLTSRVPGPGKTGDVRLPSSLRLLGCLKNNCFLVTLCNSESQIAMSFS